MYFPSILRWFQMYFYDQLNMKPQCRPEASWILPIWQKQSGLQLCDLWWDRTFPMNPHGVILIFLSDFSLVTADPFAYCFSCALWHPIHRTEPLYWFSQEIYTEHFESLVKAHIAEHNFSPSWSLSPPPHPLLQFSLVAQSCLTLCRPHESQHARPPCPSTTPRVHSDSRPSSQWCIPAISSSVIPFSSCPQSLPTSQSFPMSQLFTWGGQSTGVSALASFLPKKSQGWSPSEWTGWISLQSKGLSRVFSKTTVQKHQFFGACCIPWHGGHNSMIGQTASCSNYVFKCAGPRVTLWLEGKECMLSCFNCVTLCDPMDHTCQAPLSLGNTGEGCHFLLQGNLPGPCLLPLLHWQAGSLPLVPPGKPWLEGRDHALIVMTCPVSSRQLGRQ